jgi:hypothetical protein
MGQGGHHQPDAPFEEYPVKKLSLLAAMALLLGFLAGCGDDSSGGSDSSDSASVDEFCGVFLDLAKTAQEQGADASDADAVKLLKDLADKLEDVGTPEGMPQDAQDGLQLLIDKIKDLPDDATAEDLANVEKDFSEEDKANQEALQTYLGEKCVPTALPSDGASSE